MSRLGFFHHGFVAFAVVAAFAANHLWASQGMTFGWLVVFACKAFIDLFLLLFEIFLSFV